MQVDAPPPVFSTGQRDRVTLSHKHEQKQLQLNLTQTGLAVDLRKTKASVTLAIQGGHCGHCKGQEVPGSIH